MIWKLVSQSSHSWEPSHVLRGAVLVLAFRNLCLRLQHPNADRMAGILATAALKAR